MTKINHNLNNLVTRDQKRRTITRSKLNTLKYHKEK
jgi:hypothetical protein